MISVKEPIGETLSSVSVLKKFVGRLFSSKILLLDPSDLPTHPTKKGEYWPFVRISISCCIHFNVVR